MNWMKTLMASGVALGIVGAAAYAHGPQDMRGYGMGPGMMGGYGPNAMHPGYGMGPGMMGGYGAGMMGGAGPGMMGFGGLGMIHRLELTDTQRQQLRRIEDELRKSNWNLMGQMQDEMAKARDAWSTRSADRSAILAANKRMFELRQQMLENRLDAQGKAESLLTPQQREQYDKIASDWNDD